MKILRVIPSIDPLAGGPINGLVNSSIELIKKGHSIDVLCLDDPKSDYVKGFFCNVIAFKGRIGSYGYNPEVKSWLCKYVGDYDVVIIHGVWQYHSYITARVCKKLNIPYVQFTHGMLDPWFNQISNLKKIKKLIYWKLFERLSINNANAVLFTSEEEMVLARKSFRPYSPNECVVAYGSSAPKSYTSQDVDDFYFRYPELKNSKFGLFLSRVHEKKGIELLFKAMTEINKFENKPITIAIAGTGDRNYLNALNSMALDRRLNIVWLGMLTGSDKWIAFHASEFFILPSHQENFGIVLAEALSTGTPVLTTNKVNIWREIESANCGFIGDDSEEGIISILSKWLELTQDEKNGMSGNAVNCYQIKFSIDKAVEDLERVLHKFCK
jgi:glycosyltransferase involved in cell wall biosynthesis